MHVTDFDFDLPSELIARYPAEQRTGSRLLGLDGPTGALTHGHFPDIEQWLRPGDLLVMNNTRVIPARLFGRKDSGGQLELLVERLVDERLALVHLKSSRSPRPGQVVRLGEGDDLVPATVLDRQGDLFRLELTAPATWMDLLHRVGHMPLPPYIDRPDETTDQSRYQTVYAAKDGAVAAPTAGLHFDEPLLERLRNNGVEQTFVTLHAGAGTFQSVRVDRVEDHHMHAEYLEVGEDTVAAVEQCRARGGRVVAVGTTTVRSLETAAQAHGGKLAPFQGESEIFIYPGYQFQVIDALITNFHLPQSTLIMLVSAFAGRTHVLGAYEAAVRERYRFFSYGDAMFITHNPNAAEQGVTS